MWCHLSSLRTGVVQSIGTVPVPRFKHDHKHLQADPRAAHIHEPDRCVRSGPQRVLVSPPQFLNLVTILATFSVSTGSRIKIQVL